MCHSSDGPDVSSLPDAWRSDASADDRIICDGCIKAENCCTGKSIFAMKRARFERAQALVSSNIKVDFILESGQIVDE
ncbi:hypothetical protein DPMN_035296 [Dreissena polymorpha]|uniref:Uncharacterized protein n=1 Tax=Dreissena polymorpha TaxID=45954 RepID=A0A9D4RLS7_DREPO|nr:hypothetical protein DPMN_035296 [Dreissena polymorpha]